VKPGLPERHSAPGTLSSGNAKGPRFSIQRANNGPHRRRIDMTDDLPYPWNAYLKLQVELRDSQYVNRRGWGLEAGLDRLLQTPTEPLSSEDVERVVSSAARKDLDRERLRRKWLSTKGEPSEGGAEREDAAFEARRRLRLVKTHVSPGDWEFLKAVAAGYRYEQIARTARTPAGALRVRACRLRRELRFVLG
jgi:hypothetical protein